MGGPGVGHTGVTPESATPDRRVAAWATRTRDSKTRSGHRLRGRPAPRVCPAVTRDHCRFSRPGPDQAHPRPNRRISSNTRETTRYSSHWVLRAMARPGLEPGTPRFSVVRSRSSNGAECPGEMRLLRWPRRCGGSRKFRSFLVGSGDERCVISQSLACGALRCGLLRPPSSSPVILELAIRVAAGVSGQPVTATALVRCSPRFG